MAPDPASETPAAPARAGAASWRRAVGFAVGMALLLAAVWAVASQDMAGTWSAAARRPQGLAIVAALSVLNWVLMSATFSALMQPFGRVGRREMSALIGASWLLNYLPMRPGLLGRVAYHKAVNGIPVADSIKTIAGNVACGFVAMGCVAGIALSFRVAQAGDLVWIAGLVLCPAVMVAGSLAAAALGRPLLRSWALASLLRYLDLLVWAIRYWTVFWMVGHEMHPVEALAVACVSQAVSLVPIVGNGLGLREWAVGLTAAALPVWMTDSGAAARDVGLAADLVNRAAELAGALPVGLLSAYWLARRRAGPRPGLTEPSSGETRPDAAAYQFRDREHA